MRAGINLLSEGQQDVLDKLKELGQLACGVVEDIVQKNKQSLI